MANVDRPRGMRPVKHLNGNPYNGEFNVYYIPATDATPLYIGDLVAEGGSLGADPTGKYPIIDVATVGTGNKILGAIIGFGDNPQLMANVADLNARYKPASTAKYIAVVDDPDVIFEIQEVSGGTEIPVTDVGKYVPFVAGSGNTATGLSGHEVNNATMIATTEQLKLLRIAPQIDNAIGEHCKWWVLINEHAFVSRNVTAA